MHRAGGESIRVWDTEVFYPLCRRNAKAGTALTASGLFLSLGRGDEGALKDVEER